MSKQTPILINCRDRVTPLRELVDWLERAGHERIALIDNGSTWEPMLDYLKASPHSVLFESNHGARAPWKMGILPTEPWVYTDCDIIPIPDCPLHLVDKLQEVLDRWPTCPKAGPGLYLDDVPEDTITPAIMGLLLLACEDTEDWLHQAERALEKALASVDAGGSA